MALLSLLKTISWPPFAPATPALLDALLQIELGRELAQLQAQMRREMPENPAGYGFKVYSQADEDGILEFIFDRLNLRKGIFVEIGCGNGLENNTHYLLLNGWRGVWIDGDPANIRSIRASLPVSERLLVLEAFVDRDNVLQLFDGFSEREVASGLDLLSVDIDGNDLDVATVASHAWRPRVIVVEYNAKFPPQSDVKVAYDPTRRWLGDDYHGASLRAWIAAFAASYQLVACNLAGTNAFFVRADLAQSFVLLPPERLYQPARFHLTGLRSGHRPSLSFLRQSLIAV